MFQHFGVFQQQSLEKKIAEISSSYLPPDPLRKIITFNKLHLGPSVGPCGVHRIVGVSSVSAALL